MRTLEEKQRQIEGLKKEKELAQIIEFEDGQVVAKWSGKVNGLIIHKNLQEFRVFFLV
jgi:hypothetical protein